MTPVLYVPPILAVVEHHREDSPWPWREVVEVHAGPGAHLPPPLHRPVWLVASRCNHCRPDSGYYCSAHRAPRAGS